MAKRSKVNFTANNSSQFPTNGTGLIGANRIRTHLGQDIPDSFINVVDDLQLFTEVTGTNNYVMSGGITAYADGYSAFAKFLNESTANSELNVNSVGARKLYINPTKQAGANVIIPNQLYLLVYDSTLDGAVGGFLMLAGGGIGDVLRSVEIDVTGAPIVMNMGGATDRLFFPSGVINSNKELAFSTNGAMLRATTFLTITGTRDITFPLSVRTDTSKWVWTKPSTQLIWTAEAGSYRLQWNYDGSLLYLDIYGTYSNVI